MISAVVDTSTRSRWFLGRLSYRVEQAVTAVAVAAASAAAVRSSSAPTGSAIVDAVLLVAVAVAVVVVAGAAPWWMLASVALVAAALSASPVLLSVSVAGAAVALIAGHRHPDESALRSVAMAMVTVTLFRLDAGMFGVSAAIGSALCIVVVISGIVGLESSTRRRLGMASGVLGMLFVVALGAMVAHARRAGNDVSSAMSLTDEAVVALRDGDVGTAADKFGAAAERFESAHRNLAHPLMRTAAILPVVAQHRSVGLDVSAAAGGVAREANTALALLDGDALTVSAGHVDVDAIASLDEPLNELNARVAALRDVAGAVESPWIVAPVREALTDLDRELAARLPDLDRVVEVVRMSPELLGAHGPRRYLLLFTTPAEARAGGGFIGNYAEVVLDDGHISVGDFRRRSDLEDALAERSGSCTACADGLVDQYGRFGFDVGAGVVAPRVWSNLTMPANYPDIAQAAAVLYPQSGGREIDGVVVLDPFVMQALMQFTGPVELPQLGVVVDRGDAVDFLVRDQYLLVGDDAQEDRIDGLAELGGQVIADLLSGDLPPVHELAETLAPYAAERRLMAWLAADDEQALLETTAIAGVLPAPGPADFAFTTNNAAANKIDVFMDTDVDLAMVDVGGETQLVVDISITNRAPVEGLPRYVIGNEVGLAPGFSRTLVTFYGPEELVEATLDGSDLELERGVEADWITRRHFVDIGPGETVRHRLVYAVGTAPADVGETGPELAWMQPTTSP